MNGFFSGRAQSTKQYRPPHQQRFKSFRITSCILCFAERNFCPSRLSISRSQITNLNFPSKSQQILKAARGHFGSFKQSSFSFPSFFEHVFSHFSDCDKVENLKIIGCYKRTSNVFNDLFPKLEFLDTRLVCQCAEALQPKGYLAFSLTAYQECRGTKDQAGYEKILKESTSVSNTLDCMNEFFDNCQEEQLCFGNNKYDYIYEFTKKPTETPTTQTPTQPTPSKASQLFTRTRRF